MAEKVATDKAEKSTEKADGPAKDGDTVTVHYTGKFEDGTVFDSSDGRDPITFTIGERKVVPGFEKAIEGMKVGEKQTVTLAPEDAYGELNPQLVQEVPLEAVTKAGITPEEGMVLGIQHPQMPGQQLPAKGVAVGEDSIRLDMNHPLSGKTLTFDVELVRIE